MSILNVKVVNHKGETRVALFYAYAAHSELDEATRALPERLYSSTKRCWHIPFRKDYKEYLQKYYKGLNDLQVNFEQDTPPIPQPTSKPKASDSTITLKIDQQRGKIYIDQKISSHLYGLIKNTRKGFYIWEQKCWVFNGKSENYVGLSRLIKEAGYSIKEVYLTPSYTGNTSVSDYPKKRKVDLGTKEKSLLSTYSDTITLKRLSDNTRNVYVYFFSLFLMEHQGQDIENLSYQQIYNYVKQNAKELQPTQLNQSIASIKFFYERVMDRDKMFFHLQSNSIIKGGPAHIPFHELMDICQPIGLTSEKLLIFLVFHLQLKFSEIIKLKAGNIDSFMETVLKDELDERTAKDYRDMYDTILKDNQPHEYLFEDKGKGYTTKQVRQKTYTVIHRYRLKAIYEAQYQYILDGTEYSTKTKQMYLSSFIKFLEYHHFKHPTQIKNEEIRDYMVLHRDKSSSHQDNMVSSFKFFFERVHKSEISEKFIMRPRKGFFLPDFFTREEIAMLISVTNNIKHKFMLSLFYCSGMRREELRQLKISHIDLKENKIFIRAAKGNKDRYTLFSAHLHGLLRQYLNKEKPKHYLFEGAIPGMPYSASSMANVLKKAALSAGIRRRVHVHMLRHSFATHLLEDGWDIRYIQELMGHRNIKTTTRYTQIVSDALNSVKSPFDKMLMQIREKQYEDNPSP